MSASAASGIKWERTGEPGSAFSGLSRGRGSRGRGGHRGGRVNGRATNNTADNSARPSKPNSSPSVPNSSDTPPESTPATAIDKPNLTQNVPTKVKPPLRKQSRTNPSPSMQASATQPTLPSNSARTSTRRQRSQGANKVNSKLSKITSNETQSENALVTPVPLVKDPPPHLQPRPDTCQDIDALVERVRAVAMDIRPTTPGTHIDWAVDDDDDSLPDLNDWGVNTSTFSSVKSESISPIIVEGLKPLPDISAPMMASPLRNSVTLNSNDPKTSSKDKDTSPPKATLTPPIADEDHISNTPIAPKVPEFALEAKAESSELHSLPPKPSNRKPWHPSLPAKPAATSVVPRITLRPGATPMRSSLYTKSFTAASKEDSHSKEAHKSNPLGQVTNGGLPVVEPKSTEAVPVIVEPVEEKKSLEPLNPVDIKPLASVADDQSDLIIDEKATTSDDDDKEGLEVSIHAPKAANSTSSPTKSTSSDLPTTSRNVWPESGYAAGKSAPVPRTNGSRYPRSNQWGARGGFQARFSNRSPTSNGPGFPNTQHRSHSSRPVITGDAMSRLARTIGQTNSTS